MKYHLHGVAVGISLAIICIGLIGCDDANSSYADPASVRIAVEESAPKPEQEIIDVLTFNDTFLFDDLEITFKDEGISFMVLENRFSDLNGANVIKIPITVTNRATTSHSLNMFYVKVFNTAGLPSGTVHTHFDDIRGSSDKRSGATMDTHFHILYEGDGDYYVEFARAFEKKIEIRLTIQK